MPEISTENDLEKVKQRVGVGEDEELRTSRRRREYLDKYVGLLSGLTQMNLRWGNAAYCRRIEPDDETEQEEYRVVIPTNEIEQPVTDFDRQAYDLLMAESLSIHECGHLLYTDFESHERFQNRFPDSEKSIYQTVWNVLEDGAIEAQLRQEFSEKVERSLNVMNLNLSHGVRYTEFSNEQGQNFYTMKDAIICALFCRGVFDNGTLDNLLDPQNDDYRFPSDDDEQTFRDFLPTIETAITDVQSEPEGTERNKIVHDFYCEMRKLLDDADQSGKQEGGTNTGKPDEHQDQGGQLRRATRLGQDVDVSEGDHDPSSTPEKQDVIEDLDASDEDKGETSSDDADSQNKDDTLEEEYLKEVVQEAKALEGGEAMMDEIDEFDDLISGLEGGPGPDDLSLHIPTPDQDYSEDTYQRAKELSRPLQEHLKQSLQQEQRTKERTGLSFGTFDEQRMMPASRGIPRVFKRVTDPEDKEYSVVLLLDRSGSMRSKITDAELAVGSVMMALEGVGVDTCLISLGSQYSLEKPFGADTEDYKNTVFNSEAGGGTPLTETMTLARKRIERKATSDPFVVVMTDGRAHNRDGYLNQLRSCNFPVLGVYIGNSSDDSQNFHLLKEVGNGTVEGTVETLTRQVMV